MEVKINIGYPQVMELVGQLPERDIQKLARHIHSKYVLPTKARIVNQRHTSIQELILQAPTWTDEEYNNYIEARKHINQSRLK